LVLFVAATLFLVATPPARELRSWTAGTRAHACPPACWTAVSQRARRS